MDQALSAGGGGARDAEGVREQCLGGGAVLRILDERGEKKGGELGREVLKQETRRR